MTMIVELYYGNKEHEHHYVCMLSVESTFTSAAELPRKGDHIVYRKNTYIVDYLEWNYNESELEVKIICQ